MPNSRGVPLPALGAGGEDAAHFSEMPRAQWLAWMRREWRQGQHIAIMGRTGRGKTTLARDLLTARDWVVALAVKRADDTLETFPRAGYKLIKKWPPDYGAQRLLLWARPRNLSDIGKQKSVLARVFDDVYQNGGWCVFCDDVAYIANALGFKSTLSILLNQARSGHSSLVAAMTQPSSVSQAIPSEVWRQVRFHLIFYYRVGRDLDSIADIVGYQKAQLKKFMGLLGPWDFLCFDDRTDQIILVRS